MTCAMKKAIAWAQACSWKRDPFYGGCYYHNGGLTVTGLYDPPLFERDCTVWSASNVPNKLFDSRNAAMNAALAAVSNSY